MSANTTASPADSSDLSLLATLEQASASIDTLLAAATVAVRGRPAGDAEQHAQHGYAWLATYAFALRQLAAWGRRLQERQHFGEVERLIVAIGSGEYLAQVFGGIPMSQCEIIRLEALGLDAATIAAARSDAVERLIATGNTVANRAALAARLPALEGSASFGDAGLDATFEQMRDQMRRFAQAEVAPHAHGWHLRNEYIPMDVVRRMSELGVFALTIPEQYGGLGLGKESMCVVSEELSRAYIGVGSLGTRSEIAAELILGAGTTEQKDHWLPKIASGEVLPTAVFTEPNVGSDLASLSTRAVRSGDVYKVTGNKTWITHPVRADMMTMLVRTELDKPGYRGLSILLGVKPRGDDANPFPVAGLTGSEIEVLGYRGMKEYELAFDDFQVPAGNLLGGVPGEGFKQLMQTFEAARIQTASRALGVAQAALDLGLRYAQERVQFGKPLLAFPRVADKLVMMAVEIMIARQLTYFAAREKDSGIRCDIEAGMAKLLGARVAWAAADNALQIHGGNGFALEYPVSRLLCDARILNIFEGAAEIQAQVIGRRLIEQAG
ncbi:MAG TPA: acyl-CoA dehydrogenase family protein [Burkholderiaceae bacterium]|nr:acyl-CoA dehydrogenase family protein [Burkholderiaceae bacterium]